LKCFVAIYFQWGENLVLKVYYNDTKVGGRRRGLVLFPKGELVGELVVRAI